MVELALAHLKHPLLDGHTGVPGQADQLTVQGVEVTNCRGEVGQLHGGERVKGRGKHNDGEVGGAPWQHQHLLIPVPMDQHWALRGALVIGSQVLRKRVFSMMSD